MAWVTGGGWSLTLPLKAARWAHDDFRLCDGGRDAHVAHDLTGDVT